MAIQYNSYDKIYYGTNAERLADTEIKAVATSKFYEYDTGSLFITDGSTWYEIV